KAERHAVVARHAPAVGIHPTERVLRFGVARARRFAIKRRGLQLILGYTFAVLVCDGLTRERAGVGMNRAGGKRAKRAQCINNPAIMAPPCSFLLHRSN